MAMTDARNSPVWSRIHFLARLFGLTGLLVAAAGGVVANVLPGDVGRSMMITGSILALLALLVEIKVALGQTAGRRGAVGSNVVIQVVLAAALLAGVKTFRDHQGLCSPTRSPSTNISRRTRSSKSMRHR